MLTDMGLLPCTGRRGPHPCPAHHQNLQVMFMTRCTTALEWWCQNSRGLVQRVMHVACKTGWRAEHGWGPRLPVHGSSPPASGRLAAGSAATVLSQPGHIECKATVHRSAHLNVLLSDSVQALQDCMHLQKLTCCPPVLEAASPEPAQQVKQAGWLTGQGQLPKAQTHHVASPVVGKPSSLGAMHAHFRCGIGARATSWLCCNRGVPLASSPMPSEKGWVLHN